MKCNILVSFLCQVPEVHDLESELHGVVDWIPFGLYLGIKLPELKAIEANYPTLQRCRIEMLEEWQKNVTPTWSAVVQALVGIGMRRLASELAETHGWLKNIKIHTLTFHACCLSLQEFLLPSCQIMNSNLWNR